MATAYLGDIEINDLFVGDFRTLASLATPYTGSLIEYLVVAGGGGSGNDNAGGGGAGGLLSGSFTPETSLTFTTILGAGGAVNNNGKNSKISSALFTAESIGGGRGGANGVGFTGGSGGGGSQLGGAAGGAGTVGQGNNGGNGSTSPARAGGGGGAFSTGSIFSGGSGSLWVDGNYYAGGGGGSINTTAGVNISPGGPGGGGNGGIKFSFPDGTAGSPNTGGGGGGDATGRAGGSGIIIFRYVNGAYISGSVLGGDSIVENSGYTYHKFLNVATSSFTITL